jgi:hypothetical protein
LSPQPIWDEQATSTSVTPINETHSVATFIGNGTMTVPDTGETINMTNNGTAFVSPVAGYADTVSAYGREYVFSEDDDDDTTAITFYEIIRYDPTTFQGEGIVIAVFDNNATGSLAPFNGMMVVGTHEDDPNTQAATIILWEWQSGIPLLPLPTTMEESPPSPMNTTTTTTDATSDINATAAPEEEEVEVEEQQQCQLEITTDEETYESGDTVTITVTNDGDEALEFPNRALGLEIENLDTDEVYPIQSAQVITTLEPGESRTFEFTYEELVSEIGTGTIEASVSGEGCSASTTFTLAESSRAVIEELDRQEGLGINETVTLPTVNLVVESWRKL